MFRLVVLNYPGEPIAVAVFFYGGSMGRKKRFSMFLQDFSEAFLNLTDEKLGKVFRWIIVYYMTNEVPKTNGESFIWDMIKTELDKQEEYRNGNSSSNASDCKAGKAGKAGKSLESTVSTANTLLSNPILSGPIHKEDIRREKLKRFTEPKSDEIKEYSLSIGYSSMDVDKFIDHYKSNGWMVGKVKMKDWKAAVRNWRKGDKNDSSSSSSRKINYI